MVRVVYRHAASMAIACASLSPATSRADTQDKAVAESLYRDALNKMQQAQYAPACSMLAESQRLEPAVGTLLYLGECYERLGMTASAWAAFSAAVDAAKRVGNRAREQIAITRAERLADQVSRMTLVVPSDSNVPGLELRRNGKLIGEAAWGVALPVDPGVYVVEAVAPGRQAWTKQVTIAAGARADVTENVPVLAVAEPPAPAPVAIEPAPGVAPPVAEPRKLATPLISQPSVIGMPAPPEATGHHTQRWVGVAAAGVGVAAVAVGAVFGLRSRSKEHHSEAYCWPQDNTKCSHAGVTLINDAKTAASVANLSFVVGGVAIATGAVLYLTAPKTSSKSRVSALRIVPDLEVTCGSIMLQGRFY
jgi:serine/threonine-protein kinase